VLPEGCESISNLEQCARLAPRNPHEHAGCKGAYPGATLSVVALSWPSNIAAALKQERRFGGRSLPRELCINELERL
jgi:hypothetical protein